MKALLIAGLIFFAFNSQSFPQEYGTWYISGITPFKLIPDGDSYKVMWSSDEWLSDNRVSDSTTTRLIFDIGKDDMLTYFEFEPGRNEFTGKFIFDDKKMDAGTYIRSDGKETRFSKASFQKDY